MEQLQLMHNVYGSFVRGKHSMNARWCMLALNCCYEYKEDVKSVTSGLMHFCVKFSL